MVMITNTKGKGKRVERSPVFENHALTNIRLASNLLFATELKM